MRYRVRDGEKGDFEIEAAEVVDSRTRRWLAKCVVITVLTLFTIVTLHSIFTGGPQTAQSFLHWGERTLLLVLGYYFGKQ